MVFRTMKGSGDNELRPDQSPQRDVEDLCKPDDEATHDAVFGEIAKEGGPNYRNVGCVLQSMEGLGLVSMSFRSSICRAYADSQT